MLTTPWFMPKRNLGLVKTKVGIFVTLLINQRDILMTIMMVRVNINLNPLSARNYYEPYTFTFENGVEWSPPSGSYPRYSQATLRSMEREGRIDFSRNEPRAKRYLSEVQEGQPPDVFLSPEIVGFNKEGTTELRDIFGEGGVFPQPKPIKFIKFLLELLRSKDAIILDSFAGSGTTAHAVMEQNREDGGSRRFILVEVEPKIAREITSVRLQRVSDGYTFERKGRATACVRHRWYLLLLSRRRNLLGKTGNSL